MPIAPIPIPEESTTSSILSWLNEIFLKFLNLINLHIPTVSESNQLRNLRKNTTVQYGYYTFVSTFIIIIFLLPWYSHYSHENDSIIQRINTLLVRRLGFIKKPNLHNNGRFQRSSNSIIIIDYDVIKTIIFWVIIFSILSFSSIYSDFQFLAARLGRLATYSLPTILFLTIRPSPLPDTLYLALLPIHKWVSRIVVLQSLLHTLMYCYLFTIRNTVSKIYKRDNMYGIIAMIAFIGITISSLPYFRRKFYNFFYFIHYSFTWLSVIMLYYHVRPPIPYLSMLNVFLLLFQLGYRFHISKITNIQVINISPNLLLVKLPNDSLTLKSNIPGCHLRMIEYDSHNYLKLLYKLFIIPVQHPFTIASLNSDEDHQRLIIRKGKFKLSNKKKYLITGVYLPFLKFISNPLLTYPNINHSANPNGNPLLFNVRCKKCLIVVGGSSISFALPLIRILNYNGAQAKIIWVIRDHEDLKILDYFKESIISDDSIDIFITGNYSSVEKLNFTKAVEELHLRKMEYERLEQERMSGEIDFNQVASSSPPSSKPPQSSALPSFTSATSPSASSSSPLLHAALTANSNYGSVKLSSRPKNYKSIISSPLKNSISPNTITEQDKDLESGLEIDVSADHERELINHARQKSSYIQLTSHLKDSNKNSNYSYKDEKRFENVDLDLNFNPDNISKDRVSITDLSVVSDEDYDNSADLTADVTEISSGTDNDDNGGIAASNKVVHFKPNLGMSSNDYNNNEMNSQSVKSFPSKKRTESIASSALYDDLANYWILKGLSCRIEFGRPKLGLYYYDWCLGSSCIGPLVNLSSGQAVCYNQISQDNTIQMMLNRMAQETIESDESYLQDQFDKNRQERLLQQGGRSDENVWVIGAGPIGLVDNVRLWAVDCGFSFHAESFSI